LVADLAGLGKRLVPLYVRHGLWWEKAERAHLDRFLGAIQQPNLLALQVLDVPVADVYGDHWSVTGRDVPDARSPDAAVYLPGRNVLLLAKAMLWCHMNHVPTLTLGVLEANPFADATESFFEAFAAAVNAGIGGAIRIERPYRAVDKAEVLKRGRQLPLVHTFSCIQPRRGLHCGACNKCAERKRAFAEAQIHDPTIYVEGTTCFE
jgi:7-cyano-7-deazaguanine synthase